MLLRQLLPFLLLLPVRAPAQPTKPRPLILEGHFTQCADPFFQVTFLDAAGIGWTDTVALDPSGYFHFETKKVQRLQRTNLVLNRRSLRNLLVGPGYHLNIEADASSQATLNRSKRITGTGALANRYYTLADSLLALRTGAARWLDLDSASLLRYNRLGTGLRDSLLRAPDPPGQPAEPLRAEARALARTENRFTAFYQLLMHVYWKGYDSATAASFVQRHGDRAILAQPYAKAFVASDYYCENLLGDAWLRYLMLGDMARNPALDDDDFYTLEKINRHYRGKARALTLFGALESMIRFSKTMPELEGVRGALRRYATVLQPTPYEERLRAEWRAQAAQLRRVGAGLPAPSFSVRDTAGTPLRLEDLHGKWVYIDAWASWCAPCREEMPALQALVESYRTEKRLAIVSIAVLDEANDWRKALRGLQPGWPQYFDATGAFAKAYLIQSVPRFFLVDPEGRLLSADAPRPSDKAALDTLLRQALNR